jgi:hypothetical protein
MTAGLLQIQVILKYAHHALMDFVSTSGYMTAAHASVAATKGNLCNMSLMNTTLQKPMARLLLCPEGSTSMDIVVHDSADEQRQKGAASAHQKPGSRKNNRSNITAAI